MATCPVKFFKKWSGLHPNVYDDASESLRLGRGRKRGRRSILGRPSAKFRHNRISRNLIGQFKTIVANGHPHVLLQSGFLRSSSCDYDVSDKLRKQETSASLTLFHNILLPLAALLSLWPSQNCKIPRGRFRIVSLVKECQY